MTTAPGPVTRFAPAKINLCLHVTGRKADGYHLLDSLVVFAGVGDTVTAAPAAGLSLAIAGPEGGTLTNDPENLVLKAARAIGVDARLGLWKALPVASGIGGGSADAAATLQALSGLAGKALPDPDAVLALGADVPVCLTGAPSRMRGVGEMLSPLPGLPALWVVLANPRVPVPTPAVFAALSMRDNPPVPDIPPESLRSAAGFASWLAAATRNDLAAAAHGLAPGLVTVQAALAATTGCLLARMSGSGATCFGMFAGAEAAGLAERRLTARHPAWWVAAAPVLP